MGNSDGKSSHFGLPETTLQRMREVFRQHSQIEKVLIYGSRAMGNHQLGSDIDLTIVGVGLDLSALLKIETELDDLLLPYKIDLSLLHQIEDQDVLEHIRRMGREFYVAAS